MSSFFGIEWKGKWEAAGSIFGTEWEEAGGRGFNFGDRLEGRSWRSRVQFSGTRGKYERRSRDQLPVPREREGRGIVGSISGT